MRLSVDTSTHLPALISWQEPRSSVIRRLVVSDFKRRDGVNWPHHLVEFAGPRLIEDTRLTIKVNPKIDARRFNVVK